MDSMCLRAASSAGASCSYSAQPAARVTPYRAPSSSWGLLRQCPPLKQRNISLRCQPSDKAEIFWSVAEILQEARQEGSESLVFQDDDDGDVWDFESRIATQPVDLKEVQEKAEVKGALNADDQDILSAYSSEQGFKETTVAELKPQLDKNQSLAVLDVRTQQEYNVGHVPGAMHIPLDGLSDAVRSGCLDNLKERTICVICASGGRSAQATVRLTRVFGFPDVVNVAGGTIEWINAGFSIERS